MTQHKWHKEIKAWADGAEIEVKNSMDIDEWIDCKHPNWSEGFIEEPDWIEFRIKPQPKEPQYINVYGFLESQNICFRQQLGMPYIGKIKLED
jgi:hypothetical protein